MSTNKQRVIIAFKHDTDPTSDPEDASSFNTLFEVIMARLAESCVGAKGSKKSEDGGRFEIACSDASFCYRNIYDLLTGSPFANGATVTLIFGESVDALQESFTIGTAQP